MCYLFKNINLFINNSLGSVFFALTCLLQLVSAGLGKKYVIEIFNTLKNKICY